MLLGFKKNVFVSEMKSSSYNSKSHSVTFKMVLYIPIQLFNQSFSYHIGHSGIGHLRLSMKVLQFFLNCHCLYRYFYQQDN